MKLQEEGQCTVL